jgi:hypothetical protein
MWPPWPRSLSTAPDVCPGAVGTRILASPSRAPLIRRTVVATAPDDGPSRGWVAGSCPSGHTPWGRVVGKSHAVLGDLEFRSPGRAELSTRRTPFHRRSAARPQPPPCCDHELPISLGSHPSWASYWSCRRGRGCDRLEKGPTAPWEVSIVVPLGGTEPAGGSIPTGLKRRAASSEGLTLRSS